MNKELVFSRIEAATNRLIKRRGMHRRLQQILEGYDGKDITKTIEKVLEGELVGYRVVYDYTKDYEKVVSIYPKEGDKLEQSERITLVFIPYGMQFNFKRFMDGQADKVAFMTEQIAHHQEFMDNGYNKLVSIETAMAILLRDVETFCEDVSQYKEVYYYLEEGDTKFMNAAWALHQQIDLARRQRERELISSSKGATK